MPKTVYFLAAGISDGEIVAKEYGAILVPITSIKSKADLARVRGWIASGVKVLLDSGVFELCSAHARDNGIQLTEALGLPPEQVDGFAGLLDHYTRVGKELSGEAFALVEIDLGGKVRKRETRASLEAMGLKIAPVFHPILDGWEYLDELAETHSIIMCGNMVDANRADRCGALSRMLEWKGRHPGVWLHLLGVTPSPMSVALPIDSCDSSAWASAIRWFSGWQEFALGGSVGRFGRDMAYTLGSRVSYEHTLRILAIQQNCQALGINHYHEQLDRIDADAGVGDAGVRGVAPVGRRARKTRVPAESPPASVQGQDRVDSV